MYSSSVDCPQMSSWPALLSEATEQLYWLTPWEADTVLRQAPSRKDKDKGVWNSKASNSVWGHRSSLPSQGGPWAIVNPGPRCVRKRLRGEVSVFWPARWPYTSPSSSGTWPKTWWTQMKWLLTPAPAFSVYRWSSVLCLSAFLFLISCDQCLLIKPFT